ncbi:MAG: thiamine phosphate synthase [Leptotrichiaceae bacterium]|nr:thiamine phosphate synthase [Leptotrichiaceae bacterium]
MFNKELLKFYFVCGTQDCEKGNAEETIEKALENGVTMFQFREKGDGSLNGREKKEFAKKIQKLCRLRKIPFIVDDDIELARELNADGIHIGQEDTPVEEARKKLPDKIIGLSVGSLKEYLNSNLSKVDYIGVGPIFTTSSKNDAGNPVGIGLIRELRKINEHIPIVAIGGITEKNAKEVIKSGADGVAVISAITKSENIERTSLNLLNWK